jgi:hypothetical protein
MDGKRARSGAPTGWPRSIGACLMHTADTMRRLGRLDATAELLQEALDPGADGRRARLRHRPALPGRPVARQGRLHRRAGRLPQAAGARRSAAACRFPEHRAARPGARAVLPRPPQEALAMAEQAAQLAQRRPTATTRWRRCA